MIGQNAGKGSALPPSTLDGACLLAYAVVDETVTHLGVSSLLVDGNPIGIVPGLAICQQETGTVLLMFCDTTWTTIGVVQCSSLSEAKQRAESEYMGLSDKWVSSNMFERSMDRCLEVQLNLGVQNNEQKCSFCGQSPEGVQQLFDASGARICDSCVREFYESLE